MGRAMTDSSQAAESFVTLADAEESQVPMYARLCRAIADRREFYNESVRINNVTVERFPASVVAGWFAFRPAELLKFNNG